MLYEKGELTQEQADRIIGDKMLARIRFLNKWLSEHDYYLMLHSTYSSKINGIFADGLSFPGGATFDSREEILENSNIPEKDLTALEEYVRNNNGISSHIEKAYETYQPYSTQTTVTKGNISAKDLLEYNHKGGNTTVVFCVPRKNVSKIGRDSQDEFAIGISKQADPYLRRDISCREKDGELQYRSKYFYPTEGILFAFDRDNIRIKFNDRYKETYYLDSTTQQTGKVKDGELLSVLRNINQLMQSFSDLDEK